MSSTPPSSDVLDDTQSGTESKPIIAMYSGLGRKRWANYLARFSIIHVFSYVILGSGAVVLQGYLAPSDLVALDFFAPYRIALEHVGIEALRAVVLGVIFLPFVRIAKKSRWGRWMLFFPLWGLTIIGSIDPWVGSIEGVIYTETTAVAHIFFLGMTAIQYGILVSVLLWTENQNPILPDAQRPMGISQPTPDSLAFWGYLTRFTIVYVGAYLTAGIVFFLLHDYGTAIPDSAAFTLWRPLDHPFIQFAALFQIARGAFIGVLLLPVYGWVFSRTRGWASLFIVLWGGTYLAAPPSIRNLIQDVLSPGRLSEGLLGTAEITVQMLGFALLFWAWQQRACKQTN